MRMQRRPVSVSPGSTIKMRAGQAGDANANTIKPTSIDFRIAAMYCVFRRGDTCVALATSPGKEGDTSVAPTAQIGNCDDRPARRRYRRQHGHVDDHADRRLAWH